MQVPTSTYRVGLVLVYVGRRLHFRARLRFVALPSASPLTPRASSAPQIKVGRQMI